MRLRLLNVLRWLREYFVVWALLSFIYSVTLVLILQPLLEIALKMEVGFWPLWSVTCAVLLIPAGLEALRLPSIPGFGALAPGRGLMRLYLRHEFRRLGTWIGIAIAVALAFWIPAELAALWILAAQFPMQRALFSFQRWRILALVHHPKLGGPELMRALVASQLAQFAIAWLVLLVTGHFSGENMWKLALAGIAGVFSSAAVCLEGDAGRPWLVNFIALAAASLGGFSAYAWPVALGIAAYLMFAMSASIPDRLRSVEHLDEDTVIP